MNPRSPATCSFIESEVQQGVGPEGVALGAERPGLIRPCPRAVWPGAAIAAASRMIAERLPLSQ